MNFKVKNNIIQVTKISIFSLCFILLFANSAYAHDPEGMGRLAFRVMAVLLFLTFLVFIAGFQLYKKKKRRQTHFIRSVILAAVGILIPTLFLDFGGITYIRMQYEIVKGKKTGIIDMSDIGFFRDYWTLLNLQSFANIANLKSLDLGRTPTRDEELKHLSNLKSLEILRINSPNITDEGIEYLLSLKNLKELELRASEISDQGLKHLSNLKSLQMLWVGGNTITDEGIKYLLSLENLRGLALAWSNNTVRITDEGSKHLSNLKSLESLRLGGNRITDEGIAYLSTLEHLKKLELVWYATIGDLGLKHLSQLKSLEYLDLGYESPITDEGISYLTSIEKLKGLKIRKSQISNEGLKHISQLKSLEYLDLSYVKTFTDEGIGYLTSLENLKKLNLSGTQNSSRTNITGKCFIHLAKMKALRKLGISGLFSEEDRKYLGTALPNCKIDWYGCEISWD